MTLPSNHYGQNNFGAVDGYAYAAQLSTRVSARLLRDAQGLRLVDQAGETLCTGAPSERERISGGPCLMTFGTAWTFDTDDIQGVELLLGPSDDDWLSSLEVWHPRLFAVVAGCLIGVLIIWKWGLDILVAGAIALTPTGFVSTIDTGNLAAMDRFLTAPTELSQSDQDMVRDIFAAIKDHAPYAPYGDYTLEFRKADVIGPNAFALPGGTVVVTDALVNDFNDPNIIAGILGHELAHVSERHSLRQLYRSLSVYVLIAMMAGDVGPILEDVLLEGSALASLAYSRDHEASADVIGIKTSHAAGYDPAALAEFFEQLTEDYGESGPEWMSTHPSNAERIETIKKLAAEQ
ncbi:M48 family metallopeptidase [Pacificibacter marinus]|uniref:TPR repeat-containing protein YfgC n=1 Tax=Pacificibacter marinus TaxID=658057 RepID=A0A1Y5SV21_9RHOB|nr:M48 family metallopeptidase [Pacificibacter marinus]SEK83659.1 Peptidase family M48 [Pacificibacter marinus]SLN48499.1 TPR repeat-containing protein YfgC precursor [Pacificibacter marinus]